MKKVSRIMKEYFDRDHQPLLVESVPINVYRETWEVHESPERLFKVFEFDSRDRLSDFLFSLMSYEDSVHHHSSVKIDYLKITVEVYTHDLNRITEIDREFAFAVDSIYEDVSYYDYSQREDF